MLGWSDGGISSLILAAKYPDIVDKLVVWGANCYVVQEDIEAFESTLLNRTLVSDFINYDYRDT